MPSGRRGARFSRAALERRRRSAAAGNVSRARSVAAESATGRRSTVERRFQPLRFLSILGFVGAAMSMVGLWQERALLAGGWLGQAVQVLAVGLMLWARWTFGRRSFHAAANPTAGGLV